VTVAGEPRTLGSEVENELFYIGREAIANAVRHGAPGRAAVSLEYESDAVRLTVHDDGRGFDVAERGTVSGHFGVVACASGRGRSARISRSRALLAREPRS